MNRVVRRVPAAVFLVLVLLDVSSGTTATESVSPTAGRPTIHTRVFRDYPAPELITSPSR
ncbi:hypothetical protein [uncultured Friedmanniella sp.]|uniref:hypothetical protein n=1 Tax=uncultured Friedmanniella sp. TaxID=335381 RepID=UPI0035CC96A0